MKESLSSISFIRSSETAQPFAGGLDAVQIDWDDLIERLESYSKRNWAGRIDSPASNKVRRHISETDG